MAETIFPKPLDQEVASINAHLAHLGSVLKTLPISGTTDVNGNLYNTTLKPANHVILGVFANDKACTVFLNGDASGFNYHFSSYTSWNLTSTAVAATVYYVDK